MSRDVRVVIENEVAFQRTLETLMRDGWELTPGSIAIGNREYVPYAGDNARTVPYGTSFTLVVVAVLVREKREKGT